MAGGIFGNPFTLNEKCIVFSLIIIGLFLYSPTFQSTAHRYLILAILFIISYVAMAWYDYFYDCKLMPLRRAKYGLTTIMKPPIHSAKQVTPSSKKSKIERKRIGQFIYLSHILVFVPLLLYVAYYGKDSGTVSLSLLTSLGVLTLFYHGIRLMSLVHSKPSLELVAIYLTHILVIAPLLIYIGTQGAATPPILYNALYILAFLAFAYHLRYLVASS